MGLYGFQGWAWAFGMAWFWGWAWAFAWAFVVTVVVAGPWAGVVTLAEAVAGTGAGIKLKARFSSIWVFWILWCTALSGLCVGAFLRVLVVSGYFRH